MKIPLPAGNYIYIGKGSNDKTPTSLITKSADIVRDNNGQVVGTTNSYSLDAIEKYVDIVFSPGNSLKNFVFLFENIAEIQFPINYLTSRIKNGNFVVKRWDDEQFIE